MDSLILTDTQRSGAMNRLREKESHEIRFHDYTSPVVTLIGRNEQKKFNIHRSLLCSHSKFFKEAFSGNFKESAENTIRLPENPILIESLVRWMYTTLGTQDLSWEILLGLIVISDKYLIDTLLDWAARRILLEFTKKERDVLPMDDIGDAYNKLPCSNSFRSTLVALWVVEYDSLAALDEMLRYVNQEFLKEAIMILRRWSIDEICLSIANAANNFGTDEEEYVLRPGFWYSST
ncbi:MAG: hypothetical protein M1834_002572 [Cirrosporium novae-zelandiae]|nr:MAG: hypothetical protein M1834_002572 [Cirrosporium novae-zelandiae]